MSIIERAREYAVKAHSRINHRRKYTKLPYAVHLSAVAKIVSSVTDDENMIAAAWLHDVVEDTGATLADIEDEFGRDVARLVDELTDVSRPGDGNRAVRKKKDLEHLRRASPEAQTIKLADLTDNCLDISRNDPRFARVYLKEMADLLEVLTKGDARLHKHALHTHSKCLGRLSKESSADEEFVEPVGFLYQRMRSRSRLLRLVRKTFIAYDIAEPLRSFAAETPCEEVVALMDELNLPLIGVRQRGITRGYVLRKDMTEGGVCGDNLRVFHLGEIVQQESSLAEVIHSLTLHKFVFVQIMGDIVGYISRNEANKPEFRMWLFGIINFVELEVSALIRGRYSGESWQKFITPGRLQKAQELLEERRRRGSSCDLLDCLQFGDKGRIVLNDELIMAEMHFPSKGVAKQFNRELEALRNNLAHAQDIGSCNWEIIALMAYNLEYDASLAGH